ncbi:MAG: hypothetical protein GY754_31105 [bacterium]|nr:hypothetical protein [bacterium]
MKQTKLIQSQTEILEAKKLVYEAYCLDMNWHPPENNPSGWRYSKQEFYYYSEDHFNSRCLWFGSFDNKKLIAVSRLIPPSIREGETLELELYTSLPVFLKQAKTGEFNRAAMKAQYKNVKQGRELLSAIIDYCREQGYEYLCTTASQSMEKILCLDLGIFTVHENEFTYSADDTEPLNIVYLSL